MRIRTGGNGENGGEPSLLCCLSCLMLCCAPHAGLSHQQVAEDKNRQDKVEPEPRLFDCHRRNLAEKRDTSPMVGEIVPPKGDARCQHERREQRVEVRPWIMNRTGGVLPSDDYRGYSDAAHCE